MLRDPRYPDSDGKPIADNTRQFEWIALLYQNLSALFSHDENVFVAADLFWYPVEGHPDIRHAPDSLVAFGRRKGDRGSYMQWREGNIPPQVVWEILSPLNTPDEMEGKFRFYDQYGAEEYYLYDPDAVRLQGWRRRGRVLRTIRDMHGWISPRLDVRFDLSGPELAIYRPNGEQFQTFIQAYREMEQVRRLMKEDPGRLVELMNQRSDCERRAREEIGRLRKLGLDPKE